MKSIEFRATIAANGQIEIPPDLAREIPSGEQLKIVLEWDVDDNEDALWRSKARERLESFYAPEDAVYEQLMNEDRSR